MQLELITIDTSQDGLSKRSYLARVVRMVLTLRNDRSGLVSRELEPNLILARASLRLA